MKYDNLWTIPPVEAPPQSTESAVEILNEQVKYLNDSMGGKVSASFHKLPPADDETNSDYEGELILDGKRRDNAEEFYNYQRYAFDIYNSAYLFRMFTVYLGSFYPVEINLDRDLLEAVRNKYGFNFEIQKRIIGEFQEEYTAYMENIVIKSDGQFITLLKDVFATRKVQFMLYKLRQLSEEAKKDA